MITLAHVRQAGFCTNGMRIFAERHNLDFKGFLKNGIPKEALENIDDAMVAVVLEIAKKDGDGRK